MVFFAQKTPDFGPKNRLRIWGVPPSPLYGFFFQRKGGYGFGGYSPPPFTDKIRKVVFEVLPKGLVQKKERMKCRKCTNFAACKEKRKHCFVLLYFMRFPLSLGFGLTWLKAQCEEAKGSVDCQNTPMYILTAGEPAKPSTFKEDIPGTA